MKYKRVPYIIILFIAFSALPACTPGSCQEDILSTAQAGFYETGTGKALKADSVTLYGLGMESVKIYDKVRNVQTISFPLNASSDTSIFILSVNGKSDTVTFVYSSFPHLVSKECGFTFYHILDTVLNTRTDLDYLKKNQNVTTVNEENIRIYY